MKPKKRMNRRKALSHILSISSDPDLIIGAKEVLARKPFDYGLRSDKSQVRYENGRLIALRVLQSSLCFLVALALWAVPALAQQKWWVLSRSSSDVPDTCETGTPADSYEWAKALGTSPKISDKGDEVDVVFEHNGEKLQSRYFRTQEACQKIAQAYIDADEAEKARMDKYR
jgi:hypothetical protein